MENKNNFMVEIFKVYLLNWHCSSIRLVKNSYWLKLYRCRCCIICKLIKTPSYIKLNCQIHEFQETIGYKSSLWYFVKLLLINMHEIMRRANSQSDTDMHHIGGSLVIEAQKFSNELSLIECWTDEGNK